MPFIPLPLGAKTEVIYDLDGFPAVNVFHNVNPAAEFDAATLADLFEVYRLWLTEELMPTLSAHLQVVNMICTAIDIEGGPQVSASLAIVGGEAVDSAPANVALVYSWRTGLSGRSNRGRSYIPGLGVNRIETPQTVFAAYATAQQLVAASLITRCNTAEFPLVVASFQHDHAPRVTGVANDVTTAIVNNTLDTQRKRIKQH